ncbi:MAG: pilus assembly protein HicB [Prevotella sp.]|nr:pilus assembly protein HicB [Prevotella sp.]
MVKKKRLLAIVERGKGKRNFSCFTPESIDNCGMGGYGGTAREAMADTELSVQEYKELKAEEGKEFPNVEFDFRFDVGAFFDYYPIDVTAFAKYIGMNASVLRQYVTAIRQPKQEAIDKIRNGIEKLSRDLGMNRMVEMPPASYVK